MPPKTDSEESPGRPRLVLPPALRYPSFRAYWMGALGSIVGFQMLQFSMLWLVYNELTASPLVLGSVGAAYAVPAILLNLYGGVLADKLDKRRLIIATQTTIAALIFLLATLTLLDVVALWHVFAIAIVTGAVNAFDGPPRMAIYPHLIERKAITSAVALIAMLWQGTRIPAPAIAGFIIAQAGTEVSFFVAGAGFLMMAAVMLAIKVPHLPDAASGSAAHEMAEGVRFIKTNSVFSFLLGMSFFNSLFGMAYIILMPVFAVEMLGMGAGGAGLLLGTGGVGAVLANIWLSSRTSSRHTGLLLVGAATMAGVCIAAFALTSHFIGSFSLAIVLLMAAGAFNSTYMVSVMSSLQMMVPDHMRGRVMGFYGMTYSIMPLSGLRAGAIATIVGVPVAVALGGLAVSAFALGPATMNSRIRNLGSYLRQVELATSRTVPSHQASPSPSDD